MIVYEKVVLLKNLKYRSDGLNIITIKFLNFFFKLNNNKESVIMGRICSVKNCKSGRYADLQDKRKKGIKPNALFAVKVSK